MSNFLRTCIGLILLIVGVMLYFGVKVVWFVTPASTHYTVTTGTTPVATVTTKKISEISNIQAPTKTTEKAYPINMDNELRNATVGQYNAVRSAENYLLSIPFSKAGLIDQLSSQYEGFSVEDATFAVELLERYGLANWYEQATKSAKNYINMYGFSRDGLIQQLTSQFEGYTQDQAEYAATAVGY